MSIASDFRPPQAFDEYRLVRPLGRGGMGQVHLAHDTRLDRMVAIKFIAAAVPDETARRRLFTEARATARIQHPNVVAIHRIGELGTRPYIVSEYVQGRSLEDLTKPIGWQR